MVDEPTSPREEIPYRVDGIVPVASVRAHFPELAPDSRTGERVRLAGRLMRLRRQGRLVFADLVDSSGRMQLLVAADRTTDFEDFAKHRVLGDWVSVAGEVVTSRAGELSVAVEEWQLLAHARRGFGDKWRGVTDPDLRYRQRYVDLWANPEVRDRFLARSRVVAAIRAELAQRGFVEVETPLLQPTASGANARPFVTHHHALDTDLYLRIAPELYLKRLVIGGFERVFELGRDFRNEGISPRHNPEFTMLEAYQAYTDLEGMMELMEQLVARAAEAAVGATRVEVGGTVVDLTPPFRRATMEELVGERIGTKVALEEPEQLRQLVRAHGLQVEPDTPGRLLLALYEELVEPFLVEPIFVTEFPKEVSPLARDHRDPARVGRVEQFDLVIVGRELGTAYSELNDPDEQRRRFLDQLEARNRGDEEAMPLDEEFLRALEYGMPPTGGLGLGIDRLVMLLTNAPHIKEVILFPTLRPEQAQHASDG